MKKVLIFILLLSYIIGGFAQDTTNCHNSKFSICFRVTPGVTLSFFDIKIDTNAKIYKRYSSVWSQSNDKAIVYKADITEKQMQRLWSIIPKDLQSLPVEGNNYLVIDGESYQLQIQLGTQIYSFYDTPELRATFKPLVQYIEELERIKFRKTINPIVADNVSFCLDK